MEHLPGGAGDDFPTSAAVDPGGTSYVAGASDASWGSPVNPFTAIPAGYKDWSIAKVDNNGYLQWNTFHGGIGNDWAYGTALDQYGGVYAAGSSPSSWGTPLHAYSGDSDLAIAKLAANDGHLMWNTFYGQVGFDEAYGITVSPQRLLFVVGTSDAGWGSPINPFAGGSGDGVVVALQVDGALLGHTFLGGSGYDDCSFIQVARSGLIYVGGSSEQAWGSPDRPYTGGPDVFVSPLAQTEGSRP